ncbi:MAG: acyltransferase [Rickettsiales bacterium]|nr:acyltransferase [Rickettsiales bacterium]
MKPAYRPDIDGLRALAILSVVLFHTGLSWLPSGYVGVDIFFVISGYLIGGIIFAEIHAKTFSFANFYARRAKRILPALMLVVLASCALGYALLGASELTDLATSSAAALLGVANIKFFLRNDYFQSDSELLPMLMTWSLGVEEQFYLFFPFVLLAMARLNAKRTGLALGVISAASFIASVIVTKTHPTAAFYLLPLRAWEMGAGAMLAMRHATQSPNPQAGSVGGTIGIALLIASMLLFDETTPFPGLAASLPVAGALLLLHSPHALVNRKLLASSPLVMLGLISYSWYLWHWPLMAFARHLSPGTPPLSLMLAIAAASAVLGYASWRWVEQPFRRYKGPAPHTLAYYGAALALVLAAPLALKFTHGFPSRLPEAATRLEHTLALGRGTCLAPFGATLPDSGPDCQPQGANAAIALLGDSHASALGPGLLEYAQSQHLRLLQFTKSACTPLLGMGAIEAAYPTHPLECGQFMEGAVSRIIADKSVKIWSNLA